MEQPREEPTQAFRGAAGQNLSLPRDEIESRGVGIVRAAVVEPGQVTAYKAKPSLFGWFVG